MAYSIELLARDPITFDHARLLAAMQARLGNVEASPPGDGGTLMFLLHDHLAQFKDGAMSSQLVLLPAGRAPDLEKYAAPLQQSWAFADAQHVVAECQHCCLFADMMSAALPQQRRRRLLSAGLLAVLETSNVDVVHFVEAQQFVEPAALMAQLSAPEQQANPTTGFLNVRFFNVANAPGDMVMDTLGLSAFGLTDLQIHYRGMEPNVIARMLHTTATYLFERGDVIDTGHTVQGRSGDERWPCRHEDSLLDPKRTVLDINPGEPHAAGLRAA